MIALLAAFGAPACGPPDAAPRLAVVAREPTWELTRRSGEPAAFGVRWTAGSALSRWSAKGGTRATASAAGLVVEASSRATLESPTDLTVDPDVHHHFLLRATTRDSDRVLLQWRGVDGGFDEFRTHVWHLDGDGEQVLSVRLARLRGLMAGTDGSPLRLVFVGSDPDGPVSSIVHAIELVSDFDPGPEPEGTTRAPRWWTRAGLSRRGVLVRPGETLTTRLQARPGDRLRLSLAAVGVERPVAVRLGGRAPDGTTVEGLGGATVPGVAWEPLAVDLPDLAGPLDLALSLEPTAPSRCVVLVGSVMLLRAASEHRPDILLYVEDTLRADRLTTYGYAQPTDPHLARVAEQGVVFEHTLAASNWTRPAVTSLLTSLDPVAHGNRTRHTRLGGHEETLASVLADAGYITASFVTNWHAGSWSGLDRGFDLASEPVAFGAVGLDTTLTSALLAAPVEEFLQEHAGERVFVYVHSMDPHHPYRPPERDLAALSATAGEHPHPITRGGRADDSRRYDAEVLHNDRQLARLDASLLRLGRHDDTLLVFGSDHGEGFGEHGLYQHKKGLFQEELAVPWVLRWPGRLPAGTRCLATAGHVDMAPTLLGIVGLPAPATWQGRDLSACARGDDLRSGPVLAETIVSRTRGDGLLGELAVVWHPHKLVAGWTEDGELALQALYDLVADPRETDNRVDDPALADVVERLQRWAREQLARSRARADPQSADALDPETRRWMEAMGYLR